MCKPRTKKYEVSRWFKKVSVNHPVAVCRECLEEKEAVPVNEGELVGVGFFDCISPDSDSSSTESDSSASSSTESDSSCNQYTVLCRGIDTAICYECGEENHPITVNPRNRIRKKTNKKHSCSRCQHGRIKPCPNFAKRA